MFVQSELDATQIQQAGDDVELPTELAKMIAEDNEEEEQKQSVLGQLTSLQNMDLDQLKDKAQATVDDLKKTADKCEVMWWRREECTGRPHAERRGEEARALRESVCPVCGTMELVLPSV